MKRDAALSRFATLLVWKVSRMGRDMRQVISTVYELADLDITVIPTHSQTGPITSTMGRLLWAIQAWYVEMESMAPGWRYFGADGEHRKKVECLDEEKPQRGSTTFRSFPAKACDHDSWGDVLATFLAQILPKLQTSLVTMVHKLKHLNDLETRFRRCGGGQPDVAIL